MFVQIVATIIFILAYIGIALEHPLKVSKTAIALSTGGILWVLVAFSDAQHFKSEISHAGSEIFGLVMFLFAAMSLVEILLHYRFFDIIRGKLFMLKVSDRQQFFIILSIAFLLSAVIDNLTTTIVMIQIARKFLRNQTLLITAAGVVIAANAGGAFSPIGDVTTLMLWLAGKFGAIDIIIKGFLPSLALVTVSGLLLSRRITRSTPDLTNEIVTKLHKSEKLIITLAFSSFALPLIANFLGLPPYLGLLTGLGIVWAAIETLRHIRPQYTLLSSSIDEFLKRTDISSRMFFIGILLSVSALNTLGVLNFASETLYGESPSDLRITVSNITLGIFSAIVDNIPLTAIAIDILNTNIQSLWVLLAITVGTGGSLLVIGSAAGIVAMGMVKELTFGKYIQVAFLPALIGFIAAVGVWSIQYFVFNF